MGKRFTEVRAELSHDRLKNEFLSTVAYRYYDDGEVREKLMRDAVIGDEKAIKLIKLGCQTWKDLGPDIIAFINTLPENYGFVLSEVFEKEQVEVNVAIDIITIICQKLEEEFDPEYLEAHIFIFWEEIDKVYSLLSDLSKARRFGEYVKDIDSRLITNWS